MPGNIKIEELMRVQLDEPVLIQGLPGLGFVGKVTVEFLVEKLKPKRFAALHSTYLTLPAGNLGINVQPNGTYCLPKYDFYAYTDKTPNLVFLTGDAQPNMFGQYEVAEAVVDYAWNLGCRSIISVGGYGTRAQRDVGVVYTVVDDHAMFEKLKKYNVQLARGGSVTGACGVVLGLALERKMHCLGFLGATRGLYPDLEAARAVIKILMDMFDLPVDLKSLDKEIEEMKDRLNKLGKIQMEAMRPGPTEERKTSERYIT